MLKNLFKELPPINCRSIKLLLLTAFFIGLFWLQDFRDYFLEILSHLLNNLVRLIDIETIKVLAWPVVVIYLAPRFLEIVQNLAPLIKKFRYKNFELEFLEDSDEYLNKEHLSSRDRVARIWHDVSPLIFELAKKHDLDVKNNTNADRILQLLYDNGIISDPLCRMLRGLREFNARIADSKEYAPDDSIASRLEKVSIVASQELKELLRIK